MSLQFYRPCENGAQVYDMGPLDMHPFVLEEPPRTLPGKGYGSKTFLSVDARSSPQ